MTLAEKLSAVLQIKGRLLSAIGAKGVSISEATPFSAYPDRIAAISTGGIGCTIGASYDQCNAVTHLTVQYPAVQISAAAE